MEKYINLLIIEIEYSAAILFDTRRKYDIIKIFSIWYLNDILNILKHFGIFILTNEQIQYFNPESLWNKFKLTEKILVGCG